jgi:5-methylcytosine-specific restriction endonuclease McrA
LPANRPKNGITKNCKHCGKEVYRPKSSRHRPYCSHECYFLDRWGDSHIEIKVCPICDKEFEVFASDNKVTCSNKCSRKRKSEILRGEKSPLWRGGTSAPYHKDWRQARRNALKRDGYRCVLCSTTEDIIVHHIVPYRYSKSHDLDNLITLCRTCHGKEEFKVNGVVQKALADGRELHLALFQSSS